MFSRRSPGRNAIVFVTLVLGCFGVFDVALRFAEFVADGQLSVIAAVWLSVCVLLAMLGTAIAARWVLLNWNRLTRRVEAQVDARYKALIDESKDFFLVIDVDGRLLYRSASADRALGGLPVENIDDLIALMEPLTQVIAAQVLRTRVDPRPVVVQFSEELGSRSFEIQLNDQINNPNVGGVIVTGRDVTDSKKLEKRLAAMALKDELTQLPNRWALNNRMSEMLAQSTVGMLLLIDLDGFKGVNDSFGHPIGDLVLKEMAHRLVSICRSDELLARVGGDEFAIIAHDVDDPEQVIALAKRVLDMLHQPVLVAGQPIVVSASVGIASTDEAVTANDLFKHADTALYDAKRQGSSTITVFRQEMADLALANARLLQELEAGFDRGEFSLVYQPLANLNDGVVVGFEALMRWHSPVLGVVPPDEFIPAAEKSGLIRQLGRWALAESLSQLHEWQDQFPQESLKMSVNVSVVQLADAGFFDEIVTVLEKNAIQPRSVQLEVTESTMAQDLQAVAARLQAMQNLGVKIAIDDFGTGYSSMAQLQEFPVDCIKIDKAFVEGLQTAQDGAVVRALTDLASALGAEVVAEGIETRAQAALLAELGVGIGQGYLFSRPLPPADVPPFLASQSLLSDVF